MTDQSSFLAFKLINSRDRNKKYFTGSSGQSEANFIGFFTSHVITSQNTELKTSFVAVFYKGEQLALKMPSVKISCNNGWNLLHS